jgi:hypothetical protein
MKKIKLTITLWLEGILTNIIKFYDNIEDAILESKLWIGIIKIYNHLGELLHCSHICHETYA